MFVLKHNNIKLICASIFLIVFISGCSKKYSNYKIEASGERFSKEIISNNIKASNRKELLESYFDSDQFRSSIYTNNDSYIKAIENEVRLAKIFESKITKKLKNDTNISGKIRVFFAAVEDIVAAKTVTENIVLIPINILNDISIGKGEEVMEETSERAILAVRKLKNINSSPGAYAVAPFAAAGLGGSGILAFIFAPVNIVVDAVSAAGDLTEDISRRKQDARLSSSSQTAAIARIADTINSGKIETALILIDVALRGVKPFSASNFYLQGEKARIANDKSAATQAFKSALDLSPDFLPALESLLLVLPSKQTSEYARLANRVSIIKEILNPSLEIEQETYASAALAQALRRTEKNRQIKIADIDIDEPRQEVVPAQIRPILESIDSSKIKNPAIIKQVSE